jgi:hypothetical protein
MGLPQAADGSSASTTSARTGAISPKAGAWCPENIEDRAAPAHNTTTTTAVPKTAQRNQRSLPATTLLSEVIRGLPAAGYTGQRSQPPQALTVDTMMAAVGEWTRSPQCGHHLFMAKTTIIQITDDLDGSRDAQEVTFSFQGADYTIDLSKKNLAAFEKALKPYVDAATRVSTGSARPRRAAKSGSRGQNLAAVREWAKGAGIKVPDRGRLPKSVLDQYEAAQGG